MSQDPQQSADNSPTTGPTLVLRLFVIGVIVIGGIVGIVWYTNARHRDRSSAGKALPAFDPARLVTSFQSLHRPQPVPSAPPPSPLERRSASSASSATSATSAAPIEFATGESQSMRNHSYHCGQLTYLIASVSWANLRADRKRIPLRGICTRRQRLTCTAMADRPDRRSRNHARRAGSFPLGQTFIHALTVTAFTFRDPSRSLHRGPSQAA